MSFSNQIHFIFLWKVSYPTFFFSFLIIIYATLLLLNVLPANASRPGLGLGVTITLKRHGICLIFAKTTNL
jgi:hypothetical protein